MKLLLESGSGCRRRLTNQLIVTLIIGPLGCVLILLPLWLVSALDLNIWFLIIPVALFLLIVFGGGIGLLVLVVYRRSRRLDALFTPFGLKGSAYALYFRQYQGTFQGREARAYFRSGPLVEIEISTSLQTRLGVTRPSEVSMYLADFLGKEPLPLSDPALNGLAAFPLDPEWSQALLSQPEVPELLQHLIAFQGTFKLRHVILRPGWLRLMLYGSSHPLAFDRFELDYDLSAQQAQQFLYDLEQLASIAESLPPPLVTDNVSPAEQTAERLRSRNPYLIPAVIAIATLFSILCTSAVVIAVILLLEN